MKNQKLKTQYFLSIICLVFFYLFSFTNIDKVSANTNNTANYEENITENGKACVKIWKWQWKAGPLVSCMEPVQSMCNRIVNATCINKVKEALFKYIQGDCYRQVANYITVGNYITVPNYKTVPNYVTG